MALKDHYTQLRLNLFSWLRAIRYDWTVMLGLLILSIIGVAYTDAFEKPSHWYWLAMVPVFFGACLFLEWKAMKKSGTPLRALLLQQIQHWLGLLVAVYLIFKLRNIGSLDNQTTSLMLLLNFALVSYLSGITTGWLFRLLGIFLALCLWVVANLEKYIWLIVALAFLILVIYIVLVRYLERNKYG